MPISTRPLMIITVILLVAVAVAAVVVWWVTRQPPADPDRDPVGIDGLTLAFAPLPRIRGVHIGRKDEEAAQTRKTRCGAAMPEPVSP